MDIIIDVTEHELVPSFRILTAEEKDNLLKKLNAREVNLPKIVPSDPMLAKVKTKAGDILEIVRKSRSAGESLYYRIVMKE